MKQLSKAKSKKTSRIASKKPLAEGIIVPLDSRGRRSWRSISDKELVEYARKLIKKKEIKSRRKLIEKDRRLYQALGRRKLLDRLEFEKRQRNWASIGDEELVEHAKNFTKEKKIKSKEELKKVDVGLCHTLRKRKLLDRMEFKSKRRKHRNWTSMSDNELVEYARKFIRENKIKNRRGLEKKDGGLYHVLRKRKLLDELEFKSKRHRQRDWASMSDNELVEYAQRSLEEKRIKSRKGLAKEDEGLYSVLRRRKLLDRVFEDIENAKEKQAVQEVFDALREFGGPR